MDSIRRKDGKERGRERGREGGRQGGREEGSLQPLPALPEPSGSRFILCGP
jgi:predicted transposase YdaD